MRKPLRHFTVYDCWKASCKNSQYSVLTSDWLYYTVITSSFSEEENNYKHIIGLYLRVCLPGKDNAHYWELAQKHYSACVISQYDVDPKFPWVAAVLAPTLFTAFVNAILHIVDAKLTTSSEIKSQKVCQSELQYADNCALMAAWPAK